MAVEFTQVKQYIYDIYCHVSDFFQELKFILFNNNNYDYLDDPDLTWSDDEESIPQEEESIPQEKQGYNDPDISGKLNID